MLEDIVGQIGTLLQNQLPSKLDQIELERTDGVVLEDIQSFYDYWAYRDGRPKYPSITILGENTNSNNAISRRRELKHKISIWVADRVVAPDRKLAQTRLWRYVEAIERVLASDISLGGKAMDSTIIGHVYTLKEVEEFVRRAILRMEVLERPSTASY